MATAALSYGEGDYISDGKRLLRIIEWANVDGESNPEAVVEDCGTNHVDREILNPAMWMKIEPAGASDDG